MAETRGLLDQFGNRIAPETIAALREETAPVGAMFGRPPFTGHLAFGIDPQRLAGIVRAADNGSSLEWMILAEEIEELFVHYAAVLGKRKRQVAQLPITVVSADDDDPGYEKHAEFVREWLENGCLEQSLFDVLDALGKGYSVHEIVWEQRPGLCRPRELIYRPQRFFEFSWQDGKTLWLRPGLEPLAPLKFLVHRHPAKSGNAIRSGLTRMVAFMWAFATYTQKDWQIFVQTYGQPKRLGRYGPEASDGDKRILWRAVSSIAGDVAAIIPKSMEMEFVTEADRGAGARLYEGRLDWLNREVSKLVLGGTAGTEAINGGHAVGREHRQAEDDVEKFDAGLLNVTINRHLIAPMIALTFGPQDDYPVLQIGRPDGVPIGDVTAAVSLLGPMGFRVKASEIRDRLQLTKPDDDGDDVIGGRVEVAGAPGEKARGMPKAPPPGDAGDDPGSEGRFSARALRSRSEGFLGGLIARFAETPGDVVDALTARVAAEAAGAMHGLTGEVRAAFSAATDMADLAARLKRLKLNSDDFAEILARGMALANLAGQAELADELAARGRL